MAKKTVGNVLPATSGILKLTPYDENMRLLRDQAYVTNRRYLTSTQLTTTSEEETVPNGNGDDGVYKNGDSYALAVTFNTYDSDLVATVSGSKLAATTAPVLYDTTIVATAEGDLQQAASYTFKENKPIKDDGKAAHIVVKDPSGNILKQAAKEASALTEEEFTYDFDTGKISFHKSVADLPLTCTYYVDATGGTQYDAPATPTTKVFMVEVLSEMIDAETNAPVGLYQKIERANITGDLPRAVTQKSKINTWTYNFKSAPVPKGIIPYFETKFPIKTV